MTRLRHGRVVAALIPGALLSCSLWAGAMASDPPSSWEERLPDGEGRKILLESCQFCHTLEKVVATPRPRDQWQLSVQTMIGLGAPVAESDVETLVDYLAGNFGLPPRNRK